MQQHAEISDLEPFEALVGTWMIESIHPIAKLVDDQQRDAPQSLELVRHAALALGVAETGDPLGGGGERSGGCPDNPAR